MEIVLDSPIVQYFTPAPPLGACIDLARSIGYVYPKL